jgi:hypothetical protein
MKKESELLNSKRKKRPYSSPSVTKLTPGQAKHFVAEHANCSDAEAVDLLESLCREPQQKGNRGKL